MSFEHGDDDLIEALIKEKVPMADIADKFDVHVDVLRTFCKRKGISIPRKLDSPDANGCRDYRQLTEQGKHISPTVKRIIELSKRMSAAAIAVEVKRSKDYVVRMLELHVKKDSQARHKARVNEVKSLVDSLGIGAEEACAMIGITKGKYQYSCRQLGLHR